MGLSHSLDNSDEWARLMYLTKDRVNGTGARLLDRRLRFGPANDPCYSRHSSEFSSPVNRFRIIIWFPHKRPKIQIAKIVDDHQLDHVI